MKHQIQFYDEQGIEQTWIVEPRPGESLFEALDRTRSLYAINQKSELEKSYDKPVEVSQNTIGYFGIAVVAFLLALWLIVAWFLEN